MAARSRKKQNGSGVLPWIALLLLAVVVATFVYAHVHVVSQHGICSTTQHVQEQIGVAQSPSAARPVEALSAPCHLRDVLSSLARVII